MTKYPVLRTLIVNQGGVGDCTVYGDKAPDGKILVVDHVYYMVRPYAIGGTSTGVSTVYVGGVVEGCAETWWPIVQAYAVSEYTYETVPMRLPMRDVTRLISYAYNSVAGAYSYLCCLYHFEDLVENGQPDYLEDWVAEKEARGERPQCTPIAAGVCI